MSIENPFLNKNVPSAPENETEKDIIKPEIEENEEYEERKEKRRGILAGFKDKLPSPEELKGFLEKLVNWRVDKQEWLRDQHTLSKKQLEENYLKKYELIADGDYSSSPEREALYHQLQLEVAYYELNPNEEWTETDGEVQEREFSRGVMMHRHLSDLGLSDYKVESSQLNADQGELEVVYGGDVEKLSIFDKESAKKAIANLFDLQDKQHRNDILDKMKKSFGCQELICIVEDIFDSHEGYSDNTTAVFEDWEGDEFLADYKDKVEEFIDSHKNTFDKYQQWDEYYIVNDRMELDNLSENSLPTEWEGLGVSNNILNVLINDYGKLRLTAWERGEDEFVEALDEEVLEKFRSFEDVETGEKVIKLAKLRSFVHKSKDAVEDDNEEEIEKLRKEILEILDI